MVKILSQAETAAFLQRHPLTAEDIPSWGLEVEDGGRYYRVGLKHATGEIVIFDETVYDDAGAPVDPSIADMNEVELWWKAVVEGTGEGLRTIIDWTPLLLVGAGIVAAIWLTRKGR